MAKENFDHTVDVVVVGGGGAGLAAAVSAAENGAQVLVLEKNPHLGGTTAIAIGSFTAAGTSLQKASHIADDPVAHDEDMGKFAPHWESANCPSIRQRFAHEAAKTFEWLVGLGLEFHGPNPEPPNRVPRMHNVVPNARAYIATLQRCALRQGVRIWTAAVARRLLRDGNRQTDGRIRGVVVDREGRTVSVRARRGVILAAGDYSNGLALKRRFLDEEIADIEGINPTATGDGHQLGSEVGAALVNMPIVYGPELRFVPPPRPPWVQRLPSHWLFARLAARGLAWAPAWLLRRVIRNLLVTWQHPEPIVFRVGGILINAEGNRFCDELDRPERAVPRQPGQRAYIVLDGQAAAQLGSWPNFLSTAPNIAYAYLDDYRRDRGDIFREADSLPGLAQRLGCPPANLRAAIDRYNDAALGRAEDPFGRALPGPPLERPPFVALGPVKSYIVTTEGGLRLDEQMRVLDEAGSPIVGLYAAGSNGMGGQILWGHGLHIAWAMTSGRLAGIAAAQTPR